MWKSDHEKERGDAAKFQNEALLLQKLRSNSQQQVEKEKKN